MLGLPGPINFLANAVGLKCALREITCTCGMPYI